MLFKRFLHSIILFCGLMSLQGCETYTYMKISEPIALSPALESPTQAAKYQVAVSCKAENGEAGELCSHVRRAVANLPSFELFDAQSEQVADLSLQVQLIEKASVEPNFWDYTFHYLTFSLYPCETHKVYELRVTGHKPGYPDRIQRHLRFATQTRSGGLYLLTAKGMDLFRDQQNKQADKDAERHQASLDLYQFIQASLSDLDRLTRDRGKGS